MAERSEIDDTVVTSAAPASPGVGKLLMVSLLVSLLMSGGVGAGVYFLLKSDSPETDPIVAGEEPSLKDKKPKGPPIYHKMAEPFIVNLATPGTRFLQVTVELMTRNSEVVSAIEKHDPLIRNNLLMLLSSQSPESIGTVDGKESLRQEALAEIRRVLEDLEEPAGVEDLYFTSLVVQ